MSSLRPFRNGGFTMMEMVMVLVILGILATVLARIIAQPLEGYTEMRRRAGLVDVADHALRRMVRDLRTALPNSVQIGCGGQCLQYLGVVEGARYRAQGTGDSLDFTKSSDSFDVMGQLTLATVAAAKTGSGNACITGSGPNRPWCVVIFNQGQPATMTEAASLGYSVNAYLGISGAFPGDIATLSAVNPTGTGVSFDSGVGGWHYAAPSPQQRFFLVDTPVTYVCDTTAGTIRRYDGYAITPSLLDPTSVATTVASLNGLNPSSALLADQVQGCQFTYVPGTPGRDALVTLNVTLARDGEQVSLLDQAQVLNLP